MEKNYISTEEVKERIENIAKEHGIERERFMYFNIRADKDAEKRKLVALQGMDNWEKEFRKYMDDILTKDIDPIYFETTSESLEHLLLIYYLQEKNQKKKRVYRKDSKLSPLIKEFIE